MDDEAYVQELFAILTNPSPSGIDPSDPYGQADDRIDRYDGFGRDVRVTSARVVAGEHAPMVEIGFVLDLPDDPELDGVPSEGSFLLPVDAEWRRLSGYDDPADYAPWVAHKVVMQIHRHVRAHKPPEPPRSDLPDRDAQWAILLELLGREGTTREVSPGRLEVARRPDGRTLTVVVTPDQWEQVLLRHGIDRASGNHIDVLLATGRHDEVFLVFWEGDLERSVREELPPVRPWVQVPVAFVPGAAWYAHKPSQDLHEDQGHP